MRFCTRVRLFWRRKQRRARRLAREITDDLRYRHLWKPYRTQGGMVVNKCCLCGVESITPAGGHVHACPERGAEHVDATA